MISLLILVLLVLKCRELISFFAINDSRPDYVGLFDFLLNTTSNIVTITLASDKTSNGENGWQMN